MMYCRLPKAFSQMEQTKEIGRTVLFSHFLNDRDIFMVPIKLKLEKKRNMTRYSLHSNGNLHACTLTYCHNRMFKRNYRNVEQNFIQERRIAQSKKQTGTHSFYSKMATRAGNLFLARVNSAFFDEDKKLNCMAGVVNYKSGVTLLRK